ncbi:diguanylate cyclase domain-containing protein [Gordonia sp. (in: high G+C Gram-positive bacteria)]|uniref:diguanylate cyclase domain-containing protein n=1 Tax=Gordonia sp. (in: high G+C Gram-positive bacteria) TaxID=84139 RepID=UPI003C73AA34
MPPDPDDQFHTDFDDSGRSYRSELWLILLVAISVLLIFHSYLLRVPPELVPLGPYFVVGVVIPMVLRWLSGAQSPIRRWSSALFIVAVYIDLAALMTARIVCIRHGLDVLPIIVPVAVLASLLVVQIRFAVLAPAVIAGFAGIAAAELLFLPIDSNRLFDLAASAAVLTVPLASARELERATRTAWQRRRRLSELTRTDALTGLPNRYALRQAFAELVSVPSGRLSVAIIDVDRFKAVNDRYGHAVGDDCLRAVGRYLSGRTDPGHEFIARLSGEEFVMLWHGLDTAEAIRRAEEIRSGIARLGLPVGCNGTLTVSIGIAALEDAADPAADPDTTWTDLLGAADAALYRAKCGGRDRIATAPALVSAAAIADGPAGPTPDTAAWRAPTDDDAAGLTASFWSLRLPPAVEQRFRDGFDAQGLPARRVIMAGLLAVCALIFVFQGSVLQMPADASLFGRLSLALGIMPPMAVALAVTFSTRLRPWSAHVFIACIAVIVTAQMVQRIVQLPKGYDVVPWLMPVSVLLSMSVVQIRYSMLLPATAVLLSGVCAAEVIAFPLTGNRVLALATAALMAAVTVRFAYRVERTRRLDWLGAEALAGQSRVDPMTGLPNRRQFTADLDAALRAAHASPRRRADGLLLVDIDRLKEFNDRFGHLAGDACIRRIGRCLAQQSPPGRGSVARLGGEEFALLLAERDEGLLQARAHNAVAEVAGLQIDAPAAGEVVTVSAGLAVISATDTAESAFARADRALYRAKRGGRNRAVVWLSDDSANLVD